MHVCEPSLVVLDIAAGDEKTAVAAMSRLDEPWVTCGVGPARRVAGEPGVQARLHADIRRPGSPSPSGSARRTATAAVCR
ncbi:DUF6207 family protein [Streptomyces sp. Rer75]|uniref:DUF6207 family protein n=1 Tax=Streptomyces sp. Rer75 TaxID=2750011 RepID=UPI00211E04F1|nr:DUF6207 family protein [Streptomyces sp. Rer75]